MVLADSSVWIRFLGGKAPYLDGLTHLLDFRDVAGHELVYGELLIGDSGGRRNLLATYERMHQSATVPHAEVAAFVRNHALHGRGVSWIDIHLLASAIAERMQLWTADSSLAALARQFRVAYEPKP